MMRRLAAALTAAAIITALAAAGVLYRADNTLSDSLYQRAGMHSRGIVVFGIDEETIAALGPADSLRGAMARVLQILNGSPSDRPSVIGLDMMYDGHYADAPEADRLLAESASLYPNVVTGASVRYAQDLYLDTSGIFTPAPAAAAAYYEPYEELRANVSCGILNEQLDRDGIFRHALTGAQVPGTGQVDSFARVIYEKWCEASGTAPTTGPDGSSDWFYLPFSQTSDGYYDGFSFLDLYEGSVDPYFYRDRIVLIGPYAPGMQDEYYTSLDHASRMPGVCIQANIVEAYMKGFFPEEAGNALQLGVFFVICALAVWYFRDRRVLPCAAVWLAVCLLWVGACLAAYHRMGVVLHVLYVPAGVSVLFIFSIAANLTRTQLERSRIRNTFGHYIDPQVMEQLLAGGSAALELGGRTEDIAVLFVDVRGFTSMSEALDAQTVVEIINRYLTLTTRCIMDNHGTLDKFVGDCTMAVWNTPVHQDDPVYLACRAAMDMIEGSRALGEELMARYGRTVSFGIGVNWGPAVVGNIGAPKRLDYTAIGDTVNTAARLEANAPGGKILISRAVADALGDRAAVTSLGGSIPLKGKAEGFEVLTLDELLPAGQSVSGTALNN